MLKPSKSRGFTLVEMLISIAILAILVTLCAPAFSALLANARIRNASQALSDGLQLARVEAIRRNERVVFTLGAGTSWTVTVESSGAVVQSRSSGEGSSGATVAVAPAQASKVTFDGLGRLQPNTDTSGTLSQLDVQVPVSLGAASVHPLRVTVASGGSVRLCDPAAVPGEGTAC